MVKNDRKNKRVERGGEIKMREERIMRKIKKKVMRESVYGNEIG